MKATAEAVLPAACPVCGDREQAEIVRLERMPASCNRLYGSREEAMGCRTGTLDIVCCSRCGHVFNRAFDAALMDYDGAYENSLHGSPTFRAFADATVRRLVERYGLKGRKIVEIGCGRGEFLDLLCATGGNAGIGYDPSQTNGGPPDPGPGQHRIVGGYFSRSDGAGADFVCCRHVLEHLPAPLDLLGEVRAALRPNGAAAVYFEVPNADFIFRGLSIWDLIYEHVSCFSAQSLRLAFERSGYSVLGIAPAFGDQFLSIEAAPADRMEKPDEAAPVAAPFDAAEFRNRFDALLDGWSAALAEARRHGLKIALWGAGSKGIMFLNMNAAAAAGVIEHVVDINPRKAGHHIAGTGQEIILPEDLRRTRPDAVIVMNPTYVTEIGRHLRELGAPCTVVAAAAPAELVPSASRRPGRM